MRRTIAMQRKEFRQFLADGHTMALMLVMPIFILILFAVAIDMRPKHNGTALLLRDSSPTVRTLVSAMENSTYFRFKALISNEEEGERLINSGKVHFILTVPENFTRDLVRRERPILLLDADCSDPGAIGAALEALEAIRANFLAGSDFDGPLAHLRPGLGPFELRIHRRFNPESISRYNVIPGVIGMLLTMIGVMLMSLSVTREMERGTMENILAMPLMPLEIMIGKISPPIVLGLVLSAALLTLSTAVFSVPMLGSPLLLLFAMALFMCCNLAIGFAISSLAANQTQAIQLSIMVLMPSFLLSGFIFPFDGMPPWARAIGCCIPLTHFLRIARGIMLKGCDMGDVYQNILCLSAIAIVVAAIASLLHRRTLD
jgi:ABC-2 type transport system permease protein